MLHLGVNFFLKAKSKTMKVFFFHFNKPSSKKVGKPQITLHHNKCCHIVDNVVINVKTWGRINTKRQPHFVVVGKCKNLKIIDRIAHVS